MADYATRQDVEAIVNKAVDGITGIIRDFAHQVDEWFNRLESRVERLEEGRSKLIDTLDIS